MGTIGSAERIYAWVVEEEDGSEGIVAVLVGGGTAFPLIGNNRALLAEGTLRELALAHHEETGRPVKLVCWYQKEVQEYVG